MAGLYIAIIMVCRVFQAFFSKRSSNEIKNGTVMLGYNGYQNAISALLGLVLVLIGGNGFRIDLPTVLIAVFSGASLFLANFCSIYAMQSGTVGLVSIFGTAGMILPIAAGAFMFNKPVAPMQLAGVGIFFVSAYLLIGASQKIYTNFNFKTLLLLIGTLVANGCTMLAQQMFTVYVPDGDVSVFSFLSFAIVAVSVSLWYGISAPPKSEKRQTGRLSKNLYICGAVLAAAVFVINQLVTISTQMMSPVILFTFVMGGGTIISTLVAAVVYKEKITLRTAIGILLGIASLIVIKMFEVT